MVNTIARVIDTKNNAVLIGGGAGVGAILSGLFGGGKGALIGTAAGAGAGTVGAAAQDFDVNLDLLRSGRSAAP